MLQQMFSHSPRYDEFPSYSCYSKCSWYWHWKTEYKNIKTLLIRLDSLDINFEIHRFKIYYFINMTLDCDSHSSIKYQINETALYMWMAGKKYQEQLQCTIYVYPQNKAVRSRKQIIKQFSSTSRIENRSWKWTLYFCNS